MSGVVVRPAGSADYDAIARLSVAAYRADGQLLGEHDRGYTAALTDVAKRAALADVLVAAGPTGEVLGAVNFVRGASAYAELSRPGEAELRMLAVAPAAQRAGVGEALVRACIARATELGCAALVISVRDFSAPALRLYARLGFVRTPELDRSPAPGLTLLALRLDLSGPGGPAASRTPPEDG